MWLKISLKNRIYLHLTALFLVTFSGAAVMIWYSFSIEKILTAITDKNLAAFQSAESLEIALVNQKGFVSYYFLDSNPDWLVQLEKYRRIFSEQLGLARALAQSETQIETINRIAEEYENYIQKKDKVIQYYQTEQNKFGAELHQEVRDRFFTILKMCESYKRGHTQLIMEAKQDALAEAEYLRDLAMMVIITHILLVLLLAYLLFSQILNPVRKLIQEASGDDDIELAGNDVKILSKSVRGLIEDVGQTQEELEKSRETLLQAEKMAMVGKLAAGMAHSVRNPFTSIKMRLFSLDRTLRLSGTQKEDFKVISEEIDHIDTIVQNFLEFSRPPKLKMQPISPSTVVEMATQLLRYRLESYHVTVAVHREKTMPAIDADPDQLKEVLVNLIINACEAMISGGTINIYEHLHKDTVNRPKIEIKISDNGPGIPPDSLDMIFAPFFTTKDDGTGLGLSIVSRVIREHGGWVNVESTQNKGTTFSIFLPIIGKGL